MQLLDDVFVDYANMRDRQNGKTSPAKNTSYSSVKSIMKNLPEFFRNLTLRLNHSDDFKIVGSFGQGVVAEIPWVCVFNKKITESAQKGYYIVLLFSADMKSCFLSLHQAVTAYNKKYKTDIARERMRETAILANSFIASIPGTTQGAINLRAKGRLGKDYQSGAIQSFFYEANNLPSESVFIENFTSLLNNYDTLYTLSGDSLDLLSSFSEELYQEHALKLAAKLTLDDSNRSQDLGSVPTPTKKVIAGRETYVRDDKVAAKAIRDASFLCELDNSHNTFISNVTGQNYVEAHHLIPMSKQDLFSFSLDVPSNIVALCPTCHRLLHHGKSSDKKHVLQYLLEKRIKNMEAQEIAVTFDILLDFYTQDELILEL